MYSGFELCEAAALPGREEYLDSEKFQIRVRDYDAPGNIKTEITKLNWLRKNNPVLQSHLGLRFYPAHNDQVLLYGKMPTDHGEMILVAVNLDPFRAHEVTIEVPLWEWRLPDDASIMATDLDARYRFEVAWQAATHPPRSKRSAFRSLAFNSDCRGLIWTRSSKRRQWQRRLRIRSGTKTPSSISFM